MFDAKLIIQDPRAFAWTSLLLSRAARLEIRRLQTEMENRPIRVVSASLRGGVFASAVCGLLFPQPEFVPIDHFGPVTRLIERPRTITDRDAACNSVMIADIISGGTELKMTRSFLEWHGWKLSSAVTIASLWRPSVYQLDGVSLRPLFVLPKIVPELHVQLPPLE